MRNGKYKAKWHTREDGKVDPHPGSVNAYESQFEYQWMVYSDKVKSANGIYIRDSTNVSDLALLLFGGELTGAVTHGNGGGASRVSMLQGYVTFNADERTLRLVTGLRSQLDALLVHRIANPRDTSQGDAGVASQGEVAEVALQRAVLALLKSEDGYGLHQPTFGGSHGPPNGIDARSNEAGERDDWGGPDYRQPHHRQGKGKGKGRGRRW